MPCFDQVRQEGAADARIKVSLETVESQEDAENAASRGIRNSRVWCQ